MNLETDSPFPDPGRLFYLGIRRPLELIRQSIREGGPIQQWITRRGRRAMQRAAAEMEPLPVRAPEGDEPAIAMLTGAGFYAQTIFCLHSLLRQAGTERLPVCIVDDGSLGDYTAVVSSRFPGVRIFSPPEIRRDLERRFPSGEFPALRGHRRVYKHLRKLVDVHAVRPGWNLVLDSDMLFFRKPETVLHWLEAPSRPLVLTDPADEYGYPREVLDELAGAELPLRINVGIMGFNSNRVPWSAVETWASSLLLRHGSSPRLTQALVTMLLAHRQPVQLEAEDYVVRPELPEAKACAATLHHYVEGSRAMYFRHNWKPFTGGGRGDGVMA
ncbi:glycosyl transferase family 2 [Opitutaceae bacterium TAV5]|nr:glycosyl transferase family 2 [Opitutaceae bacterium TAV5]